MSRDLRAGRVRFRRLLLLVLVSILVDLLQEDQAAPLEESSSLPSDPTPTSMKGLKGSVREFSLPTSDTSPTDITSGSDGNLWFTALSGTIGRITPDGEISAFPLPTSDATPSAIVAGPDGALWFIEKVGFKGRGSSIGRITPNGEISAFPLLSTSHPTHITVGPDGALWFTEDGAIGHLD